MTLNYRDVHNNSKNKKNRTITIPITTNDFFSERLPTVKPAIANDSAGSQKCNFGKTDTVLLYHDLAYEGYNLVVMRNPENSFEEVWMPVSGSSLFVDGKIQVVIIPAPVSGVTVELDLSGKK
ncbi:hypothetical protein [Flavitalea sp.]|nr:hypothetical protein [Flavitalea sp.]